MVKGKAIIRIIMFLCIGTFLGGCGKSNSPDKKLHNKMESALDGIEKDSVEAITEASKVDLQTEDSFSETTVEQPADESLLDDEISMSINVMDETGKIEVIIRNDSDTMVISGYVYQLQKQNDGVWEDVPVSVVYTDIGIEINPGNQYCFTYNLENSIVEDRGILYRMIKRVYSNQIEHKLVVTFVI